MRTSQNQTDVIDQIAKATAKLANMAGEIGLDSLVYILRMAEIEARRSIASGSAPHACVVQVASINADVGDQPGPTRSTGV